MPKTLKIALILLFIHLLQPLYANSSSLLGKPANLRVAVASNFITTARHLTEEFQRKHNIEVILSSGSTGKLTTQITYGAPYDVFLAADRKHPNILIEKGLAIKDSLQTYAIGQLALISRIPLDSPVALTNVDQAIQIALANPKIAPYGAAAKSWLSRHIADKDRFQWVMGENINQTWHYFVNGGVDVAFVALSQINSQQNLKFKYWLLTTPEIRLVQSAVLLTQSQEKEAARKYLAFLKSAYATHHIQKAGYELSDCL